MERSTSPRRGLTLFGLLVILAIIALLLAMLLPAVQKVRQAANRMQCANNLKQLALAMHNYHDTTNKFPSMGVGDPNADKADSGSWCFRILPYVEQDNVYKLILQGQAANTPVPTYYSPSRRQPALYNGMPKIDYAGNAGTADDPAKPAVEDGMFTKDGIRIADITDGTSNTLLLGVKGLRATDYLTGKGAGDQGSCWTGGTVDTLRSSNGEKRLPMQDRRDADNERGFGSAEAGGVNFAFGDGSVRLIHYKIDGRVFQALCTRNGGEVVNPNDF